MEWDFKDEKTLTLRGFAENFNFFTEGSVKKNKYKGVNCLKGGGLTVSRFKGVLAKKRGVGVTFLMF